MEAVVSRRMVCATVGHGQSNAGASHADAAAGGWTLVSAPAGRAVMAPAHLLLVLAAVAVWGTNFVVIRLGLQHMPPLLFAGLRFTFAALPGIFFLPRPAVPWRQLAAYGSFSGTLQFGFLFIAMRRDISPGLASLVIQAQVFFTVGLAAVFLGERVRLFQLLAMFLAAAGLAIIALAAQQAATPLGMVLTLLAALSWAASNLIVKSAGAVNMLGYVVWASIFAGPPLFVLAVLFEGWPETIGGLEHAALGTWAAVLWQSVGNTLFGFAAWNFLLARYPAATVTPTALLVPVVGLASSAVLLGEPLEVWKLGAACLVLAGLGINVIWPMWQNRSGIGRPRTARSISG